MRTGLTGEIDRNEVRARLDAVIAAMKQSGMWEVARPADDAFVDMGAFGMRTMAFEQWLRWVFVPSVEERIAADGPWPDDSMVAVQATREGDGNPPVAALAAPLRAFDALFAPPDDEPPPSPPRAPADDAYARSSAALAAGDHATALAAIGEVLAADERHPNAHNYAGWILMHTPGRTAAQLDEAIAHFRAAVALAPDDTAPFANLCDALVAAGRDADAVAEAERADTAAAHNWLGWRLMSDERTLPRAIEHLRAAVGASTWWGVARANLGKALELARKPDEAYEQLAMALRCSDDFDRAFCYERIAAYQARHGWFRNALGSMRAALREDEKRGGGRGAPYREGLAWIEQQLRAAAVAPPPPGREDGDAWRRACELEVPPGFGARNELGEPLADDVIEVERLVRAGRWSDVVRLLEELRRRDANKLFDAVGFAAHGAELARRAGRRDEAIAIQRLVVDAQRWYASGASSGGEGLARMLAVDEALAKLAAWQAT